MKKTFPFAILGLMGCLVLIGGCEPAREPEPAPVAAPAPPPKTERFTTTVLSTRFSDGRPTAALIVDNDTGCIMTMVAPNGPRPMMVDGKWAGCEEQPIAAVIPDEPVPAPEAAQ